MSTAAHKRVLQACYSFLLPVATFLLRAGVSYREFSEIARMAFVNVASEEFGLRGRQTNVSRVSAMTGIPRKEVSRVRRLALDYSDDLRIEFSPLGDVLHRWSTRSEYLDENGLPKRLRFSEGEPSFSALVRSCAGDIPAGAVRVELIRSGAIVVDQEGALELRRRHVVPEGSTQKLISAMSFSLTSLADTIAFNSNPQRQESGWIERFVQSTSLDEEAVAQLREYLRIEITRYAEQFDDTFSRYESPANGKDGRRVGVGIYYHENANES